MMVSTHRTHRITDLVIVIVSPIASYWTEWTFPKNCVIYICQVYYRMLKLTREKTFINVRSITCISFICRAFVGHLEFWMKDIQFINAMITWTFNLYHLLVTIFLKNLKCNYFCLCNEKKSYPKNIGLNYKLKHPFE